ncbi:hypothetical protein M758_6G184300 [Ceratodon purpureus]|nr:hypothetical protein M758_6G184300 [Ceratodon purpureus]
MAEGGEREKVVAKGEDGVSESGGAAAAPKEEDKEAEKEDVEKEYTVDELLEQHRDLIDSMLAEGILDDQFSQLQMLQDESTPDFVEEVVTLFFDDSVKLLENLTESLKTDPIDYKVVDGHVHQFKGSSSSIGAQRIKKVCMTFRPCCDNEDKQGCLDHLDKVKEEFNIVRTKLGKMLELEKSIVAAGGVLPFMEF